MIPEKESKKKKLKRFIALYAIRLKDQDPDDLPDWGTFQLPVVQEEERDDFRFFGELNFE